MLGLLAGPVAAQDADSTDPILNYYVEQAEHAFESRNPAKQGISYSYRASTRYRKLDADGNATTIDSGVVDYFYSFGQLDSSKVVKAAQKKETVFDPTVPNVFDGDYIYYFFPNDPGEGRIAIGFDTPSAESGLPTGFANIDRKTFWLTGLQLYWAIIPGYKRLTKSFSFVQEQGMVFPDSLVVQGVKQGLFQTENFRIETVLSDITVTL